MVTRAYDEAYGRHILVFRAGNDCRDCFKVQYLFRAAISVIGPAASDAESGR